MVATHHPRTEIEEPLPGLAGQDGLAEVEALMRRVAVGDRVDPAGSIALEALSVGGKRLRARLALAAAEALGVPRGRAVPWAAACELLHNATLVHDDIQDGDRVRRDRPTAWARHGLAQALCAGDLMIVAPYLAIAELQVNDALRWQIASATARASARCARGQAMELALPTQERPGWVDWTWAAEGKSGTLLGLPVEGAALLAGLEPATAQRLATPFLSIGVLYQLQDDLLDLSAEKGHGRVAGDLREGRASAPVIARIAAQPDEAPCLLEVLRDARYRSDEAVIQATIAHLVQAGAVSMVAQRAERLARQIDGDALLSSVPELAQVARDLTRLVLGSARRAASLPNPTAPECVA